MCGIVFIHNRAGNSAKKSVRKRYHQQKERGKEGFGYLAVEKTGKISKFMRCTDEGTIMKSLNDEQSPIIMFHHRFPTSTPNYAEMAHPIEVNNQMLRYKYYVIHNGVITNDAELKKRHTSKGFEYSTYGAKLIQTRKQKSILNYFYNDSECLAIELALAIEQEKSKIDIRGSLAFVLAQVDKKTNVVRAFYYGRNEGSPLKLDNSNNIFSLTSQSRAASANEIAPNQLYCYEPLTSSISVREFNYGVAVKAIDAYEDWRDEGEYGEYATARGERMGFGADADSAYMPEGFNAEITNILTRIENGATISENEYNHLLSDWNELDEDITTLEKQLRKCQIESDFDKEQEVQSILDYKQEMFSYLDEQIYNVQKVSTPSGVKCVSGANGCE